MPPRFATLAIWNNDVMSEIIFGQPEEAFPSSSSDWFIRVSCSDITWLRLVHRRAHEPITARASKCSIPSLRPGTKHDSILQAIYCLKWLISVSRRRWYYAFVFSIFELTQFLTILNSFSSNHYILFCYHASSRVWRDYWPDYLNSYENITTIRGVVKKSLYIVTS